MTAPAVATETRTIDAIRAGLELAMAANESVCILGEDVTMGGPFTATKGLLERFGERRVRDTPISEPTIMGLATGAALMGRRPVIEIMFIDFITLAMDQLVNHAAKLRYMSGGQLSVPLVVRAQGGAVGSYAAHHSQSLEAWFTHVPGLKVVAPATPADARDLLLAAIADDDPVLYLEHRALYFEKAEVAPVESVDLATASYGGAAVRRDGSDLVIVAWSRMVHTALAAAELLAGEGIEACVIDLRTLRPLDLPTVVEALRRSGRCLIAQEAVSEGGFGAELAMRISEEAWDELDAPVARIGAPFTPPPFSPTLEAAFVPDADAVAAAARQLVGAASAVRALLR
jgi:pyruvate dehydrogenase E1 component beta subunit